MKTKPLRASITLGVSSLALFAASPAQASELNMFFTNTGENYRATNTWITIQRGQAHPHQPPLTTCPA
ncbi:MAG: hypothetical protein M0Q93_07025 [Terrimicrobiaceae bacterium]|nr:hypothetical protein [Terrimicrobiaceae bacterium]